MTLNIDNYKVILNRVENEKIVYNKASNYFSEKNFKLVFPTICFTGLSSILSFTTNSDLFNATTNKYLLLIIGILTSLSTITQSFSTSLAYNTRAEMFRKAADSYDKLLTKIEFEINIPNENNFMNTIEDKILAIKNECKYLPPEFLYYELIKKKPKNRLILKNYTNYDDIIDNIISTTLIFIGNTL